MQFFEIDYPGSGTDACGEKLQLRKVLNVRPPAPGKANATAEWL